MLTGLMTIAISTAFLVVLRSQVESTDRLAQSKDITFVQTWLPVDLSSATHSFDDPVESVLLGKLAAISPPMAYSHVFAPGSTNVVTVVRPDLDGAGQYYVVAYRYEEVDGDWQLARYEIRNPGQPGETVSRVGVARRSRVRRSTGSPNSGPDHAVIVRSRNQVILRPIGEDIDVKFESGDSSRRAVPACRPRTTCRPTTPVDSPTPVHRQAAVGAGSRS